MRAALANGSKSLPCSGSAVSCRGRVPGAPGARGVGNFLFAGSSAFLLLVADLFPSYWYFSLFALAPFLWRILQLDAPGARQLGFLFGLSFFSVWKLPEFLAAPLLTILTVAFATGLFALFGWAVARAKEKIGFNPLFVALLWVLFELSLIKIIGVNVGANLQVRPFGFFHGLSVLFGFLAVSFVIVLVNSVLVFAIARIVALAKARGQGAWEYESVWDLTPLPGLFAQKTYSVEQTRAPPRFLLYLNHGV